LRSCRCSDRRPYETNTGNHPVGWEGTLGLASARQRPGARRPPDDFNEWQTRPKP
jgi:hypothetical protein